MKTVEDSASWAMDNEHSHIDKVATEDRCELLVRGMLNSTTWKDNLRSILAGLSQTNSACIVGHLHLATASIFMNTGLRREGYFFRKLFPKKESKLLPKTFSEFSHLNLVSGTIPKTFSENCV